MAVRSAAAQNFIWLCVNGQRLGFCYAEDNADFSLQSFVVKWEVQLMGNYLSQKGFSKYRRDGVSEGEVFKSNAFPNTI